MHQYVQQLIIHLIDVSTPANPIGIFYHPCTYEIFKESINPMDPIIYVLIIHLIDASTRTAINPSFN